MRSGLALLMKIIGSAVALVVECETEGPRVRFSPTSLRCVTEQDT